MAGRTPRRRSRFALELDWTSLVLATLLGVGFLALLVLRHESPDPIAQAAEAVSAAPPSGYVMMAEPIYNPPFDAADRGEPRRGAGAPGSVALRVLAPRHIARTVSATPVLYWWLSELPASPARFKLTIRAEDAPEPLVERPLPAPIRPGLQETSLAALGAELPGGVALRWSIALEPAHAVASGWIERVPASAELSAELAAARPLDRASVYAAAGIWHEALEELEDVVRAAPNEPLPQRHLSSLLASAGLDAHELQP